MDSRPIGVFDSGLGGLTTVKKLAEFLPREDIIYLGDTGRVPYGPRSRDTITRYARQDAAFLAGFDIKAMVVACNTVCSVAFDALDSIYDLPLYEVVTAPARAAAALTKNGKIGVIGTAATIGSGAYETALNRQSPGVEIFPAPCPLFVPLAENGRTDPDDIAALTIADDYLKGMRESGVDTLIMGCTHYPLLRAVISKVMGPGVALVDSGAETARAVAEDLSARGMLSQVGADGSTRYFVTDSIDGFTSLAALFLETEVRGQVKQIALD